MKTKKYFTQKHDCPQCASSKSITTRIDKEEDADGESGVSVDACKKCGYAPSLKRLSGMIGTPVRKSK